MNETNTQEKVKGYNKLTEEQITMMNAIKEKEQEILNMLESLKYNEAYNQRSLALAISNIQTGFMWAVRSIARPNGE